VTFTYHNARARTHTHTLAHGSAARLALGALYFESRDSQGIV
jgi:hypothetical protein